MFSLSFVKPVLRQPRTGKKAVRHVRSVRDGEIIPVHLGESRYDIAVGFDLSRERSRIEQMPFRR